MRHRAVGLLVAMTLLVTSCGTHEPRAADGPERSSCDATKPTGEAFTLDAPITVKIPKLPRWSTADSSGPDELSVITRQPERALDIAATIRVGQATRHDDAEGSLRFLAGSTMQLSLVGDRVDETLYMIEASVQISDETTEFDADLATMLDNLEIVRR